jgi:putative selenate reductase FAD-binding subunit
MITNYHRPGTLEEALALLARPGNRPLGGGTVLSHSADKAFSVVDLQALRLDKIHKSGHNLELGATCTLQALLESPHSPLALKAALELEIPLNLRNMGTIAGALVTCDGRSPFAAVMLALDAKMTVAGLVTQEVNLGDFLPLRQLPPPGRLITSIKIPLHIKLAFETVARSPADKPIICAALAQWPSGRTRLVIGGWGASPTLALDGNDTAGIEASAQNAAHDSTDAWASAEYRSAVAAVLAKRCLDHI